MHFIRSVRNLSNNSAIHPVMDEYYNKHDPSWKVQQKIILAMR